MSDIFLKPYLCRSDATQAYFSYSREKLCEKAMFPAYVLDGGASFFALDRFGTVNSDQLLPLIMDGSLFDYWKRNGVMDWGSVFRDSSSVDYTPEWEGHIWINRLYVILIVAHQFCRTKDEKYAKAWLEIVKDWDRSNPYTRYENGKCDLVWRDMQVTWRTINLVHSIFLLGECTSFTETDWQYIYGLLKLHADHMYGEGLIHAKDPAPDNHKLQIGMALIMIGTLFPEMFDGNAFIATGSQIVTDNMRNSIFADGCNNEDSMSYSHFIARLYLETELFLQKNGYPTIPGCAETIQKQYEFLFHFASPEGKTLQIGDSYVMDAWADIEFVNSFYPLSVQQERKTKIFESSRMAVLRNDRFDVYVDAMDMTEWHQHYGRPNVLIFADGQPILVDSGSINYDRGGLRCLLNGPEGHNVIACDEIPIDDHLTKTAAAERLQFETYDDSKLVVSNCVTAADGKSYLWKRTITLFVDRVEICDAVKASELMHFVSRMHLPDCRTGYYMEEYPCQPISADRKMVSLRFGSMMERVSSDTPFEVTYFPCVDSNNRMNYAQVLLRRYASADFCETTVFRFDSLR